MGTIPRKSEENKVSLVPTGGVKASTGTDSTNNEDEAILVSTVPKNGDTTGVAASELPVTGASDAPVSGAEQYEVVTPVNHDNEPYWVGDAIYLSNKHAAPLLAVNAIKRA